jgi:hypothetical protein
MWTLFCEWYQQIWPNLAASLIWTLPFTVWHHKKSLKHLVEHLERMEGRRAEEAGGKAEARGGQEGPR